MLEREEEIESEENYMNKKIENPWNYAQQDLAFEIGFLWEVIATTITERER